MTHQEYPHACDLTNEELARRVDRIIEEYVTGEEEQILREAASRVRECDPTKIGPLRRRPAPACTRGQHRCQDVCPDAFGVPCSPPEGQDWEPAPRRLQPTYYVRHPDDSYTEAEPQPVLA